MKKSATLRGKSFSRPTGGFVLTEEARSLSLLDIFEKIGENVVHSGCPFNRESCPLEECMFDKEFRQLSDELYQQFKNITLQDLLRGKKNAGKEQAADVTKVIDLGSHTLFIAKVTEGELSNPSLEPMTYKYYHEKLKGKEPKTSPLYRR